MTSPTWTWPRSIGTWSRNAPSVATRKCYTSFDEMFDHESVASVNPLATREEQLANIRQIYPPEREALGIVALGIELIDPSRPA